MQAAAGSVVRRPIAGTASADTSAATPTARRLTAPLATGLSSRPTARSRPASSQSLLQPTAAWLVAAGALLGGGAHFANVLPDLADDAATGVRGLPHRLGATGSSVAAAVLLLAATLTLVLGPAGPPSWAGWAAAAAAVVVLPLGWYAATRATGRRVAMFRAVIVVALIDVLLLIFSGRVV